MEHLIHARSPPEHLSRRVEMWARDGCIPCDEATPQCDCAAGEKCILTSRTCNQCPTIQCIKSASSSSKGVNAGAVAGPIVAALVIASLGLFWWLRRKKRRDLARLESMADRARKAEAAGFHLSHSQAGSPPGSARSQSVNSAQRRSLTQPPPRARSPLPPAPVNAEYYDENGATIRVYTGTRGTIDLNPAGDPFSDRQSISTMGSGGTANIIPIQYIPPSMSDTGLSKMAQGATGGGGGGGPAGQSAAARALDEARQNLFHPRRPARAPDLDLRLTVPGQSSAPPTSFDPRTPGASSTNYRDSFLSGTSAAPSYWSGQSDVHLDAPKIVTSRQVQVGRLQQAEVVQFGKPQLQLQAMERLSPRPDQLPIQQSTFSPVSSVFTGSGESTIRTLTPTSVHHRKEYGQHDDEGLEGTPEPSTASTGDLRFSMGSLAYRDSMSTMGTGRPSYLAGEGAQRRDSHTQQGDSLRSWSPLPPPLPLNHGPRGSVGSSRSLADSVLGAFPMIPPGGEVRSSMPAQAGGIPQSTSVSTLDHAALSLPRASPGRGPRYPRADEDLEAMEDLDSPRHSRGTTGGKRRPETQASVADSFFGSFPFVPPGPGEMAEMPAPRGVSTTSEGLGGLDWRAGAEGIPPVPKRE
ncbi:hypothetical protein IAU60_003658 [Kwoniella sp. DSM 27419]